MKIPGAAIALGIVCVVRHPSARALIGVDPKTCLKVLIDTPTSAEQKERRPSQIKSLGLRAFPPLGP